ncbi:hypothetical protein A2U01_0110244, partial [Trifolium medium]|nr:hypothetical protein [Trifolium medium]
RLTETVPKQACGAVAGHDSEHGGGGWGGGAWRGNVSLCI